MIREMDRVWAAGGNITDFWMDYINFGHALFRSYQFLFHFIVWTIHKSVFAFMSLEKCFNTCVTLMAMALPWGFYKGARLLGLSRFESVLTAILAIFIHEKDGYGIGLTNYTYSGYGLYNQLLSTVFFPLTVGYSHRMLREYKTRDIILTSIFFSATFMSHILTGYMAWLWIAIDSCIVLISESSWKNIVDRLKNLSSSLLKFGGLCLLLTAHWLIPMIQDTIYQHKSEFEMSEKWTGFGAERVLTDLLTGNILDADRVPVLTITATIGLVFCLAAWFKKFRSALRRKLSLLTLIWIALSFGPLTWGSLLKVLPFSETLHWHRFIAGAQIALMFCSAIFLSEFWKWLNPKSRLNAFAGVVLFATLFFVCSIERYAYFYRTNTYWLMNTFNEWKSDSRDYHKALDFALAHPEARFEAGDPLRNTWGTRLKVTETVLWSGLLPQYNVEEVGGIYHHQSHTEVVAFNMDLENQDHLNLANIKYIAYPIDKKPPPLWKEVFRTKTGVMYDTGITPSFFEIGKSTAGGCVDKDGVSRTIAYYLKSPLVPKHVYPLMNLAHDCEGKQSLDMSITQDDIKTSSSKTGFILKTEKQPGKNSDIHSAKIQMTEPGLVLFKMNYHPGWRASVDGVEVPTQMVLPSFIGIELSRGNHDIRFEYQTLPLKRSLGYLGIATYLLGSILLCAYAVRRALFRGIKTA